MAPTPARHPLRADEETVARRRAIAAHPAGSARTAVGRTRPATAPTPRRPGTAPTPSRSVTAPPAAGVSGPAAARGSGATSEDGSMTTEYGLIVVVGATACSLVIQWASGGAIYDLLGGVLQAAKGLVGF